MSSERSPMEKLADREYKYGFVTDIESDSLPPGLDEDVIRAISARKREPEFMLEWRLRAYRHWLGMKEPRWANVKYPPIDYGKIVYFAAPKSSKRPRSLEEVDPELLRTYDKLGIPLRERERLWPASRWTRCSTASRWRRPSRTKLGELGIVFCSFSDAVREHPEQVRKYLGSVVPHTDNFFAALNSAVFSDGSFCYVPKGVRCPMEFSTYFRINAANTGQFERTLIVADEGAYVSYLEGCTAPMRDENQLHAAVVELVALEGATIKYSTVQNWYPGDKDGQGGIYNFVTKRGKCAGAHSKISWTQVETGSAITWKYPSCILQGDRLGRRVLLGGRHGEPAAGGHRHQDDPRREEHPEHHRLEGDLRGTRTEHLPGAREGSEGGDRCAELLPVRLDALGRPVRSAHLPLHRRGEPLVHGGARGVRLEDRRGPDLLLPAARHLRRGRGEP